MTLFVVQTFFRSLLIKKRPTNTWYVYVQFMVIKINEINETIMIHWI